MERLSGVLLVICVVGVVSSLFLPRARVIFGLFLCGAAGADFLTWVYAVSGFASERARSMDSTELLRAGLPVLAVGIPWLIWGHLTSGPTARARRDPRAGFPPKRATR